jgi:uncharacterized protein YbjT (DUF2867 family)
MHRNSNIITPVVVPKGLDCESEFFRGFTKTVMRVCLLPFAVGVCLDTANAFLLTEQPRMPVFSSICRATHLSRLAVVLHAAAAFKSNDRVLIVGGTGGVGQLVTKKLLVGQKYPVRVSSRSKARGREIFADDTVEVVELDLVRGSSEQIALALQDVAAVVISVGTTAFPTMKWWNGNTPRAIDQEAVEKIAQVAEKVDSLKKIVLLTSVGVDRTEEMPFLILNLFGVLDAKKRGEQAIVEAAKRGGFGYAIVRPGRLVGGPYTNPDIAKLLQVKGGAENGVDIQAGDTLLGDCKRDACAEAVVQCLVNDACQSLDFSIVSNQGPALTNDDWTTSFRLMSPSS